MNTRIIQNCLNQIEGLIEDDGMSFSYGEGEVALEKLEELKTALKEMYELY